MKAKRHVWSEGVTAFCRNSNCNWMRRVVERGGSRLPDVEYKRTDEGPERWTRTKGDKVPPCEGEAT